MIGKAYHKYPIIIMYDVPNSPADDIHLIPNLEYVVPNCIPNTFIVI